MTKWAQRGFPGCAHLSMFMVKLIEVFWTQVGSHPPPGEEFLSAVELEKLAQLRFARRREEWLLGRWTAKRLLGRVAPRLAGLPAAAWTVANEPDGQPYAQVDGVRLPGCLSISHRAGRAACAWTGAAEFGLGIDLEEVEPHSAAFVQDYFSPVEQALLRGEQRERNVALAWSAKEAMLKALGKGLRLDTRSVEVLRIGNDPGDANWEPLQVRCGVHPDLAWWAGWRQDGSLLCTLALSGESISPDALRIQNILV